MSFFSNQQGRVKKVAYTIKGIVLSGGTSDVRKKEGSYLFALERMDQDNMYLSRTARQLNLNLREQEIVRAADQGTWKQKDRFRPGLEPQHNKGYMKLLSAKLKVRSRTEIISMLLTGGQDFTNSFHPFPPSPQITSPSLRLT